MNSKNDSNIDVVEHGVIEGKNIPPIFSNRFNISVNPLYTRLAFGETTTGSDSNYHNVFVIPTHDAHQLAKLILSLIETTQVGNIKEAGNEQIQN